MKSMQKTLLAISLTTGFSWAALAEAEPLPFIDTNHVIIQKTAAIKAVKKLPFTHYVSNHQIDLSYGRLEDNDIPALINFLNKHPEITNLNLEGNNDLTSAGITPLASVQTLTELNLGRTFKNCSNGTCIGGLEAKDITTFAANSSLTHLDLFLHSIGDEGAIELAKNTHLKKLQLTGNNITDAGGIALASNQSLEELSLNSNTVGPKTALALAANQSLKKLNLGQTNVNDEGAIALANQSHVSELTLNYVNIGDAGAAAFANNPYLESLYVDGTKISVNGAKALAQSKTISRLGLGGDFFGKPRLNDIGDEGAIALAQNKVLRSLYLNSQRITTAGAIELAKNKRLHSLNLAANRGIGDDGAIALASHPYAMLDVGACKLTDKGAAGLAKTGYVHLYANSNFISDAGAAAFTKDDQLYNLDLLLNDIHDEGALIFAKQGAMFSLNVMFNRMSAVGIALINNHEGWKAGGTKPYSRDKISDKNLPLILVNAKSLAANQMFCYRMKDKLECTDKQNILFAPEGI